MKKWLVATALIATTISGVTQAKEWKTVRFGIEGAYPPFSWTEADGSLKGLTWICQCVVCGDASGVQNRATGLGWHYSFTVSA